MKNQIIRDIPVETLLTDDELLNVNGGVDVSGLITQLDPIITKLNKCEQCDKCGLICW